MKRKLTYKHIMILKILLLIILSQIIYILIVYALASAVTVSIEITDDGKVYIVAKNPTPFPYRLEYFKASIIVVDDEGSGYVISDAILASPIIVGPGKSVRVPAAISVNVASFFASILTSLTGTVTLGEGVAVINYRIAPSIGRVSLPALEVNEYAAVTIPMD